MGTNLIKKRSMTANEYLDFVRQTRTDKEAAEFMRQICENAGSNYEHFKHIASRRRRPSVELAKRLVTASKGRMSLMKLLDVDLIYKGI
jgi:hypothetical protein